MATTVTENPERRRYEISVDGTLAGFTQFEIDGDVATMPHTEIDPGYKGQGLATTLIRGALDDARARPDGRAPVPVRPRLHREERGLPGPRRRYLSSDEDLSRSRRATMSCWIC